MPKRGSRGPSKGRTKRPFKRKFLFRKKKFCKFCDEKIAFIDYKDVRLLQGFIPERAKIFPAEPVALVVEDIERDRGRHRHRDVAAAPPQSLFLDRAQHVQRRRFGRTDMAASLTVRTDLTARLQ